MTVEELLEVWSDTQNENQKPKTENNFMLFSLSSFYFHIISFISPPIPSTASFHPSPFLIPSLYTWPKIKLQDKTNSHLNYMFAEYNQNNEANKTNMKIMQRMALGVPFAGFVINWAECLIV